jgi:glycosyltransferase involved in cell wall biosynthesis
MAHISQVKKIALIDPQPFAHSAGYYKAALSCCPKSFPCVVHVYAAIQKKSMFDTESVLRNANFRGYKCELFFKKSISSSRIIQALSAPLFLHWANNLAKKDEIDHVYFLSLDSILGWLVSPFRKILFSKITNSFSGIIFNANAFSLKNQYSFKKQLVNLYDRRTITKAAVDENIRHIDFLDHELSKKFDKGRPSIDPWTSYTKASKHSAQKKLDLNPGQKTTILSLGVHHPRKGTQWLIKSLCKLGASGDKNWHLILAGPIPESSKAEIQSDLSKLNDLGITSSVFNSFIGDSETWTFYQASDIFVAPYINFEGSSNASIRACAAGIPIIVSKNQTMVNVIKSYGCGKIIDSYTESSLAECLSTVRNLIVENPSFYSDSCRSYAAFHSEENFRKQIADL